MRDLNMLWTHVYSSRKNKLAQVQKPANDMSRAKKCRMSWKMDIQEKFVESVQEMGIDSMNPFPNLSYINFCSHTLVIYLLMLSTFVQCVQWCKLVKSNYHQLIQSFIYEKKKEKGFAIHGKENICIAMMHQLICLYNCNYNRVMLISAFKGIVNHLLTFPIICDK